MAPIWSVALMKIDLEPINGVLKVNATFRARAVPLPATLEAPVSSLHFACSGDYLQRPYTQLCGVPTRPRIVAQGQSLRSVAGRYWM